MAADACRPHLPPRQRCGLAGRPPVATQGRARQRLRRLQPRAGLVGKDRDIGRRDVPALAEPACVWGKGVQIVPRVGGHCAGSAVPAQLHTAASCDGGCGCTTVPTAAKAPQHPAPPVQILQPLAHQQRRLLAGDLVQRGLRLGGGVVHRHRLRLQLGAVLQHRRAALQRGGLALHKPGGVVIGIPVVEPMAADGGARRGWAARC